MISRILKCLTGFIILCAIQFLCNLVIRVTHIVIPSPILGIIVFAFLLHFGIIKKDWVRDICNLLLRYMPLLFVPLFAGIVSYYWMIEKNIVPILLNVLLASTLTLIITAIFVENVIKYVRLHKIRKIRND